MLSRARRHVSGSRRRRGLPAPMLAGATRRACTRLPRGSPTRRAGGGLLLEGASERSRACPNRGKGVGPADVLGVPHQHQLETLLVHLFPADRDQQLGARAARAGRCRCFREPPVAKEAGIDDHAVLRRAPVLRVALPRRQRLLNLWRATDQRHDRSAEARPSAEHECRRVEQSEQRRVSRHRPLDLWRAKAGLGRGRGSRTGAIQRLQAADARSEAAAWAFT
eukprot:scaffold79832_cov67-Phaeocystis_antarctica.AAC.3